MSAQRIYITFGSQRLFFFLKDLLGDFFWLGGGQTSLELELWVMYERPSDAACKEEK